MFDAIATVLAWFYSLIPNYAIAIALLTLTVMVLLTPLTVGTLADATSLTAALGVVPVVLALAAAALALVRPAVAQHRPL